MSGTDRRTFVTQAAGALAALALMPDYALPASVTGAPRRIGIIGYGRQGRLAADELQKIAAVEVAGICDVMPARVQAGVDRVPGAAGFADYRRMLEPAARIEAVIVATPTHLHRQVVQDALAAGVHVFCEAPLAATADDARAIAAAATAAAAGGTVFQGGLYARSNPIYRRAWSLARTDTLRDFVSVHGQNYRKTTWRFPAADRTVERAVNWRLDPAVSTGLPGELGTHQVDVASWFRGRPPSRVSGLGSLRLHHDGREVPDTISLILQWDDGVMMHYAASLANSHGGEFEVLHGTNGALRLTPSHGWMFKEADAATQGWEVYATRQQFQGEDGIVLSADATQLAAQGRLVAGTGLEHPSLYYALMDFVRSFAEGTPVACSAADALTATLVGIAAHRAVATGSSVEIGSTAP
jgi:predicted dehydrogenase